MLSPFASVYGSEGYYHAHPACRGCRALTAGRCIDQDTQRPQVLDVLVGGTKGHTQRPGKFPLRGRDAVGV